MPKKRSTKQLVPHVSAVVPAPGVAEMQGDLWIDVEEDLPDGPEMVLIFCPHGIERVWLGFYDRDCWRDVSGERLDGMDGPTHWRDRPSGPAVGKAESGKMKAERMRR
jgi:hypothetical protein